MAPKGTSRKRQTQLSFAPLPTSSPQREGPSSATQNRAAYIRYTGSPSKKIARPTVLPDSNINGEGVSDGAAWKTEQIGIPTPAASSQPQFDGIGSEKDRRDNEDSVSSIDEPQLPARSQLSRISAKSTPKRNATSFFQQAASPPARVQPPLATPDRPPIKSSNSLFKNKSDAKDQSGKGSRSKRQKLPWSDPNNSESDNDIEVAIAGIRKHKKETSEEEDDEGIVSSSRPRQRAAVSALAPTISDADDSDESLILRKSKRMNQEIDSKADGRNKINRGDRASLQTPARQPRSSAKGNGSSANGNNTTNSRSSRNHGSSPIESSFNAQTDDSGEGFDPVGLTQKRQARREKKHHEFVVEDQTSDSESDAIVSPLKRRRNFKQNEESPRKVKKELREIEDLQEDLDFLKGSESEGPPPDTTAKPTSKELRRLNLEKMKARRDLKNQRGGRTTLDEVDVEEDTAGLMLEASHEVGQLENLDEYDKDFVIEPETEEEMDLPDIPLQFTSHAHAGAKHHFKFVVEWMVHNKIDPAFSRNDELYQMAFQKVDDEAQAYSNSKFISSIWKPDFSRALRARPIFTEQEVRGKGVVNPHCAACNRTSHPASYKVTLSGKAYHSETLENLKEDDPDDSSSSADSLDDDESVDMNGQALPSEDHEFYLGSFCKANSARAHALLHWKWHLNDWVIDWLGQRGYTAPDQIVERDRWSQRKRQRFANRVVDEMELEEIKNLWRDFKNQISEAREQKLYYRR